MKKLEETIGNIQFDHSLWLSEITFLKREIAIYEDRLIKLLKIYFGKEEQEELTELLHNFESHRQSLKLVKKQIASHIRTMNQKILSNGELKSIADSNHHKSREMMDLFRRSYSELKYKFHQFFAVQ